MDYRSLCWRNPAVDGWATMPVKRTPSATKRTSDPVEMRDTGGRALHSLFRGMACVRPCRPHADTTYIDTNNRISLASGQTLSKAALFRVRLLHLGGWIGFGFFVWALRSTEVGPVPAALEAVIWLSGGVAVTLGLRAVFRRAR